MILSVEKVFLAFGGVRALSDVSFDVKEHEIRAIIGPNGAGKSSMLNVLNGVYHPQQGTIRFRDQVWPGDVLTCKAVVTGKRVENGEGVVEADMTAENQRGVVVTTAKAVFALPRRGASQN